ncbi:alpha/beta hydrolase [Streptomyces viridochromogenes]|uniref:Alpha/beta hydrolase n=1 Tax=Streptomyces viridochromogenes TaxID=1938 RepID=A0A0J7Z0N5_STRVR|nr:alpha/beta hydrolase [Streptomyces viridochromogenes]KMS69374.1 alpha/beta hydrolase [Streptomyces viridochromogenes]
MTGQVAGHVIPYEVQGNGPERVLALHHWLSDRSSFGHLRRYLDGSAFSYAFVDCRGYGEAMDTPGTYTMEEIAADALAVADDLGWNTFSVIGHSMGGKAAQLMLLDAPSRVHSIVGISPVPASGFPLEGEMWELFVGAVEDSGNRRTIFDVTTGSRHDDAWLDARVSGSERCSSAALRSYLESWTRGSDIHGRLEGNPTPVLVVAGANDPAMGPDTMRSTWLKWYPNAELEVFNDAGHFAPDESPQALATVVERFLGR